MEPHHTNLVFMQGTAVARCQVGEFQTYVGLLRRFRRFARAWTSREIAVMPRQHACTGTAMAIISLIFHSQFRFH